MRIDHPKNNPKVPPISATIESPSKRKVSFLIVKVGFERMNPKIVTFPK